MASSNVTYDTLVYTFRFVCNIFFREIRPRGTWNVPKEGPVILVAAPHHNQVRVTSVLFQEFQALLLLHAE